MRRSSHKAAHSDAQAEHPTANLRAPPPLLLVDERPTEDGVLSMSICLDKDGSPAAVIVHGSSAARMRAALLQMAAEQGDERAQHQLAELEHAKSCTALAAESEARIKRSLLTVK